MRKQAETNYIWGKFMYEVTFMCVKNLQGLFTCVKMCAKKEWGEMCVKNGWGKCVHKMYGKTVGKTCGMEGTRHQSDILHSLIFYYSRGSSNVQCMLTPISSILNNK